MQDQNSFRLRLKFWGVRGSTPTPQIENLSYGGNTACLEVRLPTNEIFIFDGGTGVRNLGISLVEEFKERKLSATFLLTHYHWDHIQGIPFFAPLYAGANEFTFYSFRRARPGRKGDAEPYYDTVREMLEGQMKNPYFPINFAFLPSKRDFREIHRDPIKFGNLNVHPFPLNHPQGALGYRIESEGAVIVYASDLEHGHRELDSTLREFAQNADILIYDSQYTPEEYEQRKGWGHSTWLEATKVANDSRVKQLILFHHDPSHTDQMFFEVVQQARMHFENTLGAKEGWVFIL
ncbi:MAG TPA: MBL fold metallo-hydrolase [Acidobacteriota bacterium]|nr:MBL fold metallo-hydrolase [Acidobacteriota bacterium]